MANKKSTYSTLGKTSVALLSSFAAGGIGTAVSAASHTVQAGDSFYSIASLHGMNPYDLAAQNGKGINDFIHPGDVLQVTNVSVAATPAASGYTVQAGDSFYSIAIAHGITADALAAHNGKTINDFIHPGDVLQVPGAPAGATQTAVVTGEAATNDVAGVVLQTPTTHGNSFPIGQCTWAVKELAPWVNNWWGNAKDWAKNAVAYNGYSIGDTPVVGAIAVWDGGTFGHVAYVTDVQSANSIQVMESNYLGQKAINNYRGWFDPTTAQGKVTYIYPR